ncbi:hypothetical protein KO02_17720 [Sphingobacterium sp. ML3W]|uniref:alanine racemase n=1 Tax=Sphingobacterium sp. ML3W TaxID=1538644 RepID=UPI0004F6D34C|nr:alanine racemase [Sphingobacterium sp. ML3W]AIM38318.1 hypothetical protein KO02_17720 [Sphingobacterium sp. ML3W]
MFSAKHYPLTPIIHEWVTNIIKKKGTLSAAIEKHASPINILCKDSFENNINLYNTVFEHHGIKSKIYFARKANKSILFPITSHKTGNGVDTASYNEVKQCLEAGIPSSAIVCTAAVKNRKLLELLVENKIEVVLDNEDEIDLLEKIGNEMDREIDVIVRLCGFKKNGKNLPSRFGFQLEEAYQLISLRMGKNKSLKKFKFKGLHFHLNGYDIEERAYALFQSYLLIERLKNVGIKTQSLDMGGGILMNYLADENEWQAFKMNLKRAIRNKIPPITYGNDGLGMLVHKDEVIGNMNVYPYFNTINKDLLLNEILNFQFRDQSLGALLSPLNTEIRMEPGRSLLDQCGITVAKVAFRKYDTEGNLLIGLEMNRTQLRSSSADFLLDPIHIREEHALEKAEEVFGYLVGAYCLEQELILKRKLLFSYKPQVGDLFVFVNTAGYMMHFYESEAHQFDLAKNLVYDSVSNTLS